MLNSDVVVLYFVIYDNNCLGDKTMLLLYYRDNILSVMLIVGKDKRAKQHVSYMSIDPNIAPIVQLWSVTWFGYKPKELLDEVFIFP